MCWFVVWALFALSDHILSLKDGETCNQLLSDNTVLFLPNLVDFLLEDHRVSVSRLSHLKPFLELPNYLGFDVVLLYGPFVKAIESVIV